jgi:hypothetical protein
MRRIALVLTVGFALLSSRAEGAEKQLKPFIAITFGSQTTFVVAESTTNVAIGVGASVLWDIVGIDVDVGHVPGFFETGQLVGNSSNSVTTVTGSLILTLPQRVTGYSLRPYFVGGGGFMRVRKVDVFEALPVHSTLPALNLGGGATGFVSDRWGLNWDVRYFRGSSRDAKGLSIGSEQLSFWRASMAVVLR